MRGYELDGMRSFQDFLRMDNFSSTFAYGIFLSSLRSDLVQVDMASLSSFQGVCPCVDFLDFLYSLIAVYEASQRTQRQAPTIEGARPLSPHTAYYKLCHAHSKLSV